jgi:hypothetical protein
MKGSVFICNKNWNKNMKKDNLKKLVKIQGDRTQEGFNSLNKIMHNFIDLKSIHKITDEEYIEAKKW